MRLLFVHDHIFSVNGNLVYSNKLPYPVWERYLGVFDSITVVGRKKNLTEADSIPYISSGKGVDFVFYEQISSIFKYPLNYVKKFRELEGLANEYDGIIVRLPSVYGTIAASVAVKLGKPFAVEVVGCAFDSYWNYGGVIPKFIAPIAYWKMRKIVKKAKFVLYVTHDFLQKRYPTSTYALEVSVSNVEITRIAERRDYSKYLEKQPIVIGTIGALNLEYKGVHLALSALSELKSKRFEYRVLGGGDPEYLLKVAKSLGVEGSFFRDGVLAPGAPIERWLDSLDIYLQPSLSEGLPRALIEAMASGCPAIGSTAGGIPELLDDCVLTDPRDSKRFVSIIEKVVSNKDFAQSMSLKNQQVASGYVKEVLDVRRYAFLRSFRMSCESSVVPIGKRPRIA